MISTIFNFGCDIAPRFHREIVLIAGQLAKAYISADDYKLLATENLRME